MTVIDAATLHQPAATGVWDRLKNASTAKPGPLSYSFFCIVIAAIHHSPGHRDVVGQFLPYSGCRCIGRAPV